jgi:hypothetical protein
MPIKAHFLQFLRAITSTIISQMKIQRIRILFRELAFVAQPLMTNRIVGQTKFNQVFTVDVIYNTTLNVRIF